MTDHNTSLDRSLPQHKLVAYSVALELLRAVNAIAIRDAGLRDQARRAAKSTCLNIAEGIGRLSRPDKNRAFAIARGEVVEVSAAVEIAAVSGEADEKAATHCNALASRVYALLTGLIRK